MSSLSLLSTCAGSCGQRKTIREPSGDRSGWCSSVPTPGVFVTFRSRPVESTTWTSHCSSAHTAYASLAWRSVSVIDAAGTLVDGLASVLAAVDGGAFEEDGSL